MGAFRTIAYLHRGPLAQLGQSTGLLIRVSRVRIPDGPLLLAPWLFGTIELKVLAMAGTGKQPHGHSA